MAASEEFKPKVEDTIELNLSDFPLPPPSLRQENSTEAKCERTGILDFGDEGFLLKDVLTGDECKFYITEGEKIGFEPAGTVSYRNSQRICFRCEALADALWPRIRSHLSDIRITADPYKQHIHGIKSMLKGTWTPNKLNPVFRLCRYYAGGHFAPHFDGHLVENSRCRSLQTFMLYLNGRPQFEGGATNFVHEDQALYKDSEGRYCAEEKNILCSIQPENGLAIIFNHHRLHEGQALRSGTKYILRTDIMFEKEEGEPVDAKDEEALKLVQQAEREEASNNNMVAMELYRKVFKMSPSVAQAYGN